ncbi:hypothetical protein SDC9_171367 [bioreactor metagenome]|uniref:Uncharacterized protein n=1 Tax=bioreactor metagenome TaxID=1076179 RepID=A0A645GJ90_9ZZZZ
MEIFLLYLWVQLDTFHNAAIVGILLCLTLVPVCLMAWANARDGEKEDREVFAPKFLTYGSRFFIGFIVCCFIAIFLPSSKGLAYIVGGKLVIDTIENPKVKQIGENILDQVELFTRKEKK